MIYTIGFKKTYSFGLSKATKDKPFRKLGRTDNLNGTGEYYGGGSVWKTKEEAEAYLRSHRKRMAGYGVYGVLANWDKDTEQLPGEPFRRLITTSLLVAV